MTEGGISTLFNVPSVLTESEAQAIRSSLRDLWKLTYGAPIGLLEEDLERCRRFFDPLIRGQSLRERLSDLPRTPQRIKKTLAAIGEPLVTTVDHETLLVGVEGRIVLDVLHAHEESDLVILSIEELAGAQFVAMSTFRRWSTARLTQVIDLRQGRGREVLQAVSVGLMLALLVNRSDAPDRALYSRPTPLRDQTDVDAAIYAGAERFAAAITARKTSGRSSSEQTLRGGYGLTEAKRRLAHRLSVVRGAQSETIVYIPQEYRDEVVEFLARDLARRPSLDRANLERALDELIFAFRASAQTLAKGAMVFERAGDTQELRAMILHLFDLNRPTTGQSIDESG